METNDKKEINVYEELAKIKDYELRKLAERLREIGGEAVFDEEDQPIIAALNSNCEVCKMHVSRVILYEGDDIMAFDDDNYMTARADDILYGDMTEILAYID